MIALGTIYIRNKPYEKYYISKIIESSDKTITQLWFTSYAGKTFKVTEEWVKGKVAGKEMRFAGQLGGMVSVNIAADKTEYIFEIYTDEK